MNQSTYVVNGMTCEHCAASVSDAVRALDGVRGVDVDLEKRQMVLTSDAPLPAERVTQVVREAGFQLVS